MSRLFCLLAGALTLLRYETSQAGTFTVTNLNDSGAGSLRDAITMANNTGGDDIINFAPGLTGTIQLNSVLPNLSTNIDLQGPGAGVVTVRRNTGGAYRIFTVSNGGYPAPTVRIAGLTIANANTPFILPPQNFGGGVYNDYGVVTIENCTFSGNIAAYGGAIYSGPPGAGPGTPTACTVNSCVFNGNHAMWRGGAIVIDGGQNGLATLSVFNSTFTSNSTENEGGGAISITAGNGATTSATISLSTFSVNQTGTGNTCVGGAIHHSVFRGGSSTVTVRTSTFAQNQAVFGGAIYTAYSTADNGTATFSVNESTFQANSATQEGGAMVNVGSVPAGASATSTLNLSNCTLVSNSAPEGTALLNVAGTAGMAKLNITACTLSNNFPSDGAGSTVFNRSTNGGSATFRPAGSIFAVASGGAFGNDAGSIISSGYNLTTDNGSGFFTGPGDLINTDPKLDPAGLQNNGGSTRTIALTAGSPALDASQQFGLPTDQRGLSRPFDNPNIPNHPNGNGADIGAFEARADPIQGGIGSLVVNTAADHDDGVCGGFDCTLREAVGRSNALAGANAITFDPGITGTITLTTLGEIAITDGVAITGPGARLLTVSGNQTHRVFSNSGNGTIISGLTIRDGWNTFGAAFGETRQGGAIFNTATLTLTECAFTGNFVRGGDAASGTSGNGGLGQGGAIFNSGNLTLHRCLFYRESSGSVASGGNGGSNFTQLGIGGNGGAGQGGAVYNAASATLSANNCTFNENSVSGGGGGNGGAFGGNGGAGAGGAIYSEGTMTLTACTISGNHGGGGAAGTGNSPENNGKAGTGKGGVVKVGAAAGGVVRNTIIATNTASGGGLSYDVDGGFTSQGYNLIGTAGNSTGFGTTGDQTGTDMNKLDPLLATLANNGGPTNTRALLANSPAIDKGNSFGLTTDQRGISRPLENPSVPNATGGDGSDIGAFEADAPQIAANLVVTNNQDHDDGLCGFVDCTLREAINAANSLAGDNTINFAPAVTGTIGLGSALPNVATNINIQGPGARTLQVSGNNLYRVFSFTGGTSSMSSLTVTNGRMAGASPGSSGSGGGIFNQGTLTLIQCAIKNSSAAGAFNFGGNGGNGNGGGVFNSGTLSMDSCTASGNSATGGGGRPGSRATPGGRGGSANGAGVCNSAGTMTLTNCTISGNSALGGSGGDFGDPAGDGGNGYAGVYNTGTLTMTACTVSGNSGTGGGGGDGITDGSPGVSGGGIIRTGGAATVRNTISAGNGGFDVIGAFTSQGYNLIGSLGTATGFTATGDQTGVTNPVLGLLQNNGGPTDTIAPFLSPTLSPAIDKGNSFALLRDQRGHLRIADSPGLVNATGGDGADIGAFEFHPLTGSDNDGDGMSNDFETFYGFNPGNPSDGPLDSDGDGLTNAQEYQAGTNPRDPNSNLRVIAVAKNGNDFSVTFSLAVLGKKYRLTRKDALTDSFWGSINGVGDFIPMTSGSAQITDPNGASGVKRAYRVEVVP